MGNSCDKETLDELEDVQQAIIDAMTKSTNKYLTLDIPRRLAKSTMLAKYAVETIKGQRAVFKSDKKTATCSVLFVAASTTQGLWLVKAVENILDIRPYVKDYNQTARVYMRFYDLEGFHFRIDYGTDKLVPLCVDQDLVLVDNVSTIKPMVLKDAIQRGDFKQVVLSNTFTTEDQTLYNWFSRLNDNNIIKLQVHPEKNKGTMSHFSISTTVVPVVSHI